MLTQEFDRIFQINDIINDFIIKRNPSSKKCHSSIEKNNRSWLKLNNKTENFCQILDRFPIGKSFTTILSLSYLGDDLIEK
jgi:hypothetical protein